MSWIRRMFKFLTIFAPSNLSETHEEKLIRYDQRYEEQERRLDDARLTVLEGRFRDRYGAAAAEQLRKNLDGATIQHPN